MFAMKLSEAHFRRQKRHFWQKIIATGGALVFIAIALFTFVFWVKAVIVEVMPEAAANKAQFGLDGLGWLQQNKVYLLAPKANLEISATGFITKTIVLERETLERNITVKLEEAPAIINATATPDEPQIEWRIDTKYAGSGPRLQAGVEPGVHVLEILHPHYQPQKTSLDLERGTEQTLAFVLEPVQGQINLSSEPEGVPILLNGKSVGQTPISLAQRGGIYQLQIETADFESIDDTIEITYQKPVVYRDYQLIYKKALLSLTLSPADGQLLVNGKVLPMDTMPLGVAAMQELIINYSKVGYFPETIKRTFKPGQEANLSISLKAEFGKVVINATPHADIEINGKSVGQTPQTLKLSALPHSIHLSKPGYRSVRRTIRPSSRRTMQINETLLTEQQARVTESPKLFKNSIGLELLLFKPDKAATYKLGAHRSEKGQRANEILRSVRLDKPFYISRTELSARHYHNFNPQIPASDIAVSNVSWSDAAHFCNWLSKQENLPQFYITDNNTVIGYDANSIGYRLPSEAEWEWLARYANRSASVQFIWGNQTTIPKNAANLADESAKNNVEVYIPRYNDGYPKLAPIGSFKQDSAGLYDLAGNVGEWVHNVYSVEATTDILHNPLGISNNTSNSGHVVKGSSWRSGTLSQLRSAYRQRATAKADDRGFRIARYIY